jgi:hypothetical protein
MESLMAMPSAHHHTTGTAALEDEFCDFIERNAYYSTERALARLLECSIPATTTTSGISFLLRVAHRRGAMQRCLELIARHGPYHISGNDVGFLINRNYSHLLLQTAVGGHVFRALPHWQQLEIILLEMLPPAMPLVATAKPRGTSTSTGTGTGTGGSGGESGSQLTVPLIFALLKLIPNLDESSLVRLCKFIDPASGSRGLAQLRGSGPAAAAAGGLSARGVQQWELFITAMLRLAFVRTHHSHTDAIAAIHIASATGAKSRGGGSAVGSAQPSPGQPQSADRKGGSGSSDDGDVLFGRAHLHRVLRTAFKHYRSALMIHRAIDWRNLEAAAVIYECAGQWSDAVECRLRAAQHDVETAAVVEYFDSAEAAAAGLTPGSSPFAAADALVADPIAGDALPPSTATATATAAATPAVGARGAAAGAAGAPALGRGQQQQQQQRARDARAAILRMCHAHLEHVANAPEKARLIALVR